MALTRFVLYKLALAVRGYLYDSVLDKGSFFKAHQDLPEPVSSFRELCGQEMVIGDRLGVMGR
ncbi:hypothetical protein WG66_012338, partial [Moniliophthora roreri]